MGESGEFQGAATSNQRASGVAVSFWSGVVTPEVRLCPNWVVGSPPGMGPGR
jgi:hypothetical protein